MKKIISGLLVILMFGSAINMHGMNRLFSGVQRSKTLCATHTSLASCSPRTVRAGLATASLGSLGIASYAYNNMKDIFPPNAIPEKAITVFLHGFGANKNQANFHHVLHGGSIKTPIKAVEFADAVGFILNDDVHIFSSDGISVHMRS